MVDNSENPVAAPASNDKSQAAPMTQNLQTCGVKLKTTDGMVDINQVQQIASKQVAYDAPLIKMISSNQSQEYFAVATTQGFEIIQNDSSSNKLKKKI